MMTPSITGSLRSDRAWLAAAPAHSSRLAHRPFGLAIGLTVAAVMAFGGVGSAEAAVAAEAQISGVNVLGSFDSDVDPDRAIAEVNGPPGADAGAAASQGGLRARVSAFHEQPQPVSVIARAQAEFDDQWLISPKTGSPPDGDTVMTFNTRITGDVSAAQPLDWGLNGGMTARYVLRFETIVKDGDTVVVIDATELSGMVASQPDGGFIFQGDPFGEYTLDLEVPLFTEFMLRGRLDVIASGGASFFIESGRATADMLVDRTVRWLGVTEFRDAAGVPFEADIESLAGIDWLQVQPAPPPIPEPAAFVIALCLSSAPWLIRRRGRRRG